MSAYLAFCRKVLVRRDVGKKTENFTIIHVHTRLLFGKWDVPRRVTQAGMPLENDQSPSSGTVRSMRSFLTNATFRDRLALRRI